MMILARRSFIAGLGASLIASPAIVRASSLMPVKVMQTEEEYQAAMMSLFNRQLAVSMRQTKEIIAANLMRTGTFDGIVFPRYDQCS